jgi:hypothetical protein
MSSYDVSMHPIIWGAAGSQLRGESYVLKTLSTPDTGARQTTQGEPAFE